MHRAATECDRDKQLPRSEQQTSGSTGQMVRTTAYTAEKARSTPKNYAGPGAGGHQM
jgi:hypothetical protein